MSAPILQPGDRIHLAIPQNTTRDLERDLKAIYARQYITIVNTLVCAGITRPEIIAVFRPHEQDPS